MSKQSNSEPAVGRNRLDSENDLGACYCYRDTLGQYGILRRCTGFLRRPFHITDTRRGVLMAKFWDLESNRKDNLRWHYNPAWAGPLDAIAEPLITAEATIAHTEREPTTQRRSHSAQKLVSEDSNGIKQSNMSFGETLKSLRLRSGQSRYRLAESSGITQAYILRLESGEKSKPSREVVIKLGLSLIKGSKALEIWEFDVLLLSAGYA